MSFQVYFSNQNIDGLFVYLFVKIEQEKFLLQFTVINLHDLYTYRIIFYKKYIISNLKN